MIIENLYIKKLIINFNKKFVNNKINYKFLLKIYILSNLL